MANYATLKAAINAVIKANGNKEITGTVLNETLTAMVNSLGANYQFAGVATPSTNPGTPDQNVFYLAGQAGTYTNFNSIVLPDGVSILKWNGSWSSETVLAGDGVFDISAYKATGGTLATFADLSAALDGGNNIPQSLRKGGMSVKFVQSSEYVQYRLMAQSFTTDTTQWQGVDDEPAVDSDNLVKSSGISKWVGDVNIREVTIKQQATLIAENVEKGSVIYAKVLSNSNNVNIGLFSGNSWQSTTILWQDSIGETIFTTIEDYSSIYLVTYQYSNLGEPKVAIGVNKCLPRDILDNKISSRHNNIIVGREDRIYSAEHTAPFFGLVSNGIVKATATDRVSERILINGEKFLYYKNLRNTGNSKYSILIYNSSDSIIGSVTNENEVNEGCIYLEQSYPTASYIIFSPSNNASLIDNSYVLLSSERNHLINIKEEIEQCGRISSVNHGLLRDSVLFGNNIKVFTEEDCIFNDVLLKRNGTTYYPISGCLLSDFIDLTGFNYIFYYNIFPNPTWNYTGMHLYDSSKNHIAVIGEDGVTTSMSGCVSLSDYNNAKYLRYSPFSKECLVVLSKTNDYISMMELLLNAVQSSSIATTSTIYFEIVDSGNERNIVLSSCDGNYWNIGLMNNGFIQNYKNNTPTVSIPFIGTGARCLYLVLEQNNNLSFELGDWMTFNKQLNKGNKKYYPIIAWFDNKVRFKAPGFKEKESYYVLDASGNGDIQTITQSKKLPFNSVVIVRPGRYKTTSQDTMNRGITFIGEDIDKCIFYNDDNDYYTTILFQNGCCRNITFISEENSQSTAQIRPYAVHIDHAPVVDGIKYGVRFENCKFISCYAACVGIGMRKDFELSFINCDFIQKGSTAGSLSLHNCVNNAPSELQGSGTIIISGCRMLNESGDQVLVFALKTSNGTGSDGILDQYPTKWIIQNSSFYSRTSGKNCIYANDPQGVYGTISTIPSAVDLDGQSFNNNINLLNT